MSEENNLGEAGPSGTTEGTTSGPVQNTELVSQVFSMFKGYLSSQLEEKGKQLQTKASGEKTSDGIQIQRQPEAVRIQRPSGRNYKPHC